MLTVALIMREGGVNVAFAGNVSLKREAIAFTHGYAVAPLIGLPGPDLHVAHCIAYPR